MLDPFFIEYLGDIFDAVEFEPSLLDLLRQFIVQAACLYKVTDTGCAHGFSKNVSLLFSPPNYLATDFLDFASTPLILVA